jgi:hypothetical protein
MSQEKFYPEHKLRVNYPDTLLEKLDLEAIAIRIKNAMASRPSIDLNSRYNLRSFLVLEEPLKSAKIKDVILEKGALFFYSPTANDEFINNHTNSSKVIILDIDHPTDMICVDYTPEEPKAWFINKTDIYKQESETSEGFVKVKQIQFQILKNNIERLVDDKTEHLLQSIKEKLTRLTSQFESFGQIYHLVYQNYPDLIATGPVARFGDNSETAIEFESFISDMESTILRKSKQLSKLRKLKPLFQAEYFKQQVVENQEQINLLRNALLETLDTLKGYSLPRKSNGSDVTNYSIASESIKKLAQTMHEIIEMGNKDSLLQKLVVRFFIKTIARLVIQNYILDSESLKGEIETLVDSLRQHWQDIINKSRQNHKYEPNIIKISDPRRA